MINLQAIGRLRLTLNKYLTETCTIEARVDVVDIYGGASTQWQTVASGVSCRVIGVGQQNRSAQVVVGEQRVIRDEVRIVLPMGTVVATDYRVTVNAVQYKITRIVEGRSDSLDVIVVAERLR